MEENIGGDTVDLSARLGKLSLSNPVMPASGPLTGDDKKMLSIAAFGVGAMVTKTISTVAAKVPRPCIIATNNHVVNTELWSEFSYERWLEEFIPAFREKSDLPLIVSLGYSPIDLEKLVPLFCKDADAFELSTHYVADDPSLMEELISAVKRNSDRPVFLKLDPSVADPAAMVRAIEKAGGDGVVAINSLGPVYPYDAALKRSPMGSGDGDGWVSGPAIKMLALSMVRRIREVTDLPVIGVGGIASAGDVVDFLSAGADAVQLLSGALIKGKDIYARIISSLPKALESRGFNSVVEAVSSVRQPAQSFEVRNPVIDHDRCTRCGLCVSVCPYFALSLDERVEIDGEACFGCGLCQSRCPVGAIGGVLI
ncbi:MAG TPA: 4Fe-4S binding protein [Mesotoga sp.]|nr:4Fe-4S binding protein [Mesotoga sp.]